ncbi:MAG: transporter substrate-binding domain-containing protein [Succinivibrio sp.]|nr:transporter substrate-binding domain-containing protein [Succinivibrio sp.]
MKVFTKIIAALALAWVALGLGTVQAKSDFERLSELGTIQIGLKNAVGGFGYKDPTTGYYVGMEADLARLIAEELGLSPEFTTVTHSNRLEMVAMGNLDLVIATCTVTEERKQRFDFSIPYFTDMVGVMVRKSSQIRKLSDLKDQTVGVGRNTNTPYALLSELKKQGLIAELPDEKSFDPQNWEGFLRFKLYDYYETLRDDLFAGKNVDAFCGDYSVLESNRKSTLMVLSETFDEQPFAVVARKGSDLIPRINVMLKRWLEDGTIKGLLMQYGLD